MALLDQYGRNYVYPQTFEAAINSRDRRPWHQVKLEDIDDLLPSHDWQTILSVSRKLFANSGVIKGAIEQKAQYSVGRGWDLSFKGKDAGWGREAAALLQESWFNACDIRGPNYNFKTLLDLDSIALDRDGDYFILPTLTPTGYPQSQRIPSHRVGYRGFSDKWDASKFGAAQYDGMKVVNGVITNKAGRPVAYNILGDDPKGADDRQVEAWKMIHVFDPDWYGQSRGIPSFAASLNELRDGKQSHEWEQRAMLMASSVAAIEYNETGMPDPTDPMNMVNGSVKANTGFQTSTFEGGAVRHYEAGTGNKMEIFESNRPGDMWDRFNDRLIKIALAGINWPVSMIWQSTGQGTAERADLERAARSVEDRQDVLRRPALRLVRHAIAAFIKQGRLDEPPKSSPNDWLSWGFTNPPKINIDPGRTGKIFLDMWRAGMLNTDEILAERGQTEEDCYRKRAIGIAMRKRIAREVSEATGEEISDEEMSMMTPNGNPKNDDDDETTDSKPA